MILFQPFKRLVQSHWPFLALLVLSLPLLYIRLAQVPYPWYDEGLNLNAARSLATTGQFGLTAADGIRLDDPAIQTGPPLLLPMALLYRRIGANLLVMRLVMTVFGILAMIAMYALVFRLYDSFAAFLTILFLLLMPGDSTSTLIMLSRQVLGEVPAILCMALGLWLMLSPRPRGWHPIVTGFLFGAAITLKSQVFLILSLTVGVWIIYYFARRIPEWPRWTIVAILMLAIYARTTLGQEAGVPAAVLASNSATLREGIFIHFLGFRFIRNLLTPSVVLRVVIMSGTIWLMWGIRRGNLDGRSMSNTQRRMENFLLLFTTLWLFWFAVLSIGWDRYAYIGLVFTFVPLSRVVSAYWKRWRLPVDHRSYAALVGLCLVAFVLLFVPDLLNKTGDQFYAMMDYIRENVPADAHVVTWEWPASLFTPNPYYYPNTHAANQVTRQAFYGVAPEADLFDSLKSCPSYVLLGSFDIDRQVLKPALDIADPTPVFASGIYELYNIPADKLNHLPDGTCAAADTTDG